MSAAQGAAHLLDVIRDGHDESAHLGHVAVAVHGSDRVAGLGAPAAPTYPRSALKPFQTAAVLRLLGDGGPALLGTWGTAIATASHTGTAAHQVEAARLLAEADLDESWLGCPTAVPADPAAARAQGEATRLAFNCSGKHAAMLLAAVRSGADPGGYLAVDHPVQVAVRAELAATGGAAPDGPGVDGCGAPAWRWSTDDLARAGAVLAAAPPDEPLGVVRAAMSAHPWLIGGADRWDSVLMAADPRVVAKGGAEGVGLAALRDGNRHVGVAVKIADGAARAVGPVVATVLAALGAEVPDTVRAPVVLGGDEPHGAIAAAPTFVAWSRDLS